MKIAKRHRGRPAGADAPLGTTLAPVDDLRRHFAATLAPAAIVDLAPDAAIGAILAEDLAFSEDLPTAPTALRAGWAVASNETIGASPYAPVAPTRLVAVEPGDAVPSPLDAVVARAAAIDEGGVRHVQETVSPGADLLRRGWCASAGAVIGRAGTTVTPTTALLAEAAGIATLSVRRPRVAVSHDGSPRGIAAARALALLLGRDAVAATLAPFAETDPAAADLVVAIGRGDLAADDPALTWWRAQGQIEGGGLALVGCEAVAWGRFGATPALLLPGRPEELVVACAALVGPIVATLADDHTAVETTTGRLTRKLVSQIGFTELAFLGRTADGGLEPLATGRPPWTAIGAADAWIELGPECEGHGEGMDMTVRPMPFGCRTSFGAKA